MMGTRAELKGGMEWDYLRHGAKSRYTSKNSRRYLVKRKFWKRARKAAKQELA
jgi:hypothetical protein